jgi:hypothetical protein
MRYLILAALAAAYASAVNAFVVVPEIAEADSDIVRALPFDAPLTAESRSVSLACPGCPVHFRHDDMMRKVHDVPSHLELLFTIDASSPANRLLLNGFELYPNANPWQGPLTAPQVLDFLEAARGHRRKGGPRQAQLGYTLAIHPVMKEEADQKLSLVDVELQVIEVGETFVDGIPVVRVRLIETPTGQLMIANVETIEPAQKTGESDAVPAEQCETLICKWTAFVRAKLAKVKGMKHGCGGMRHGHHKGMPKQQADGSRVIHNHHHSWKQLFKNITSYIFLPVLIGIVAGVSLSIIGMMVGTIAVCIWRVLVRRQRPWTHRCHRHRHHKTNHAPEQVPVAGDVEDEKSGLMEHQEPPPEYEAAPLIEEQPVDPKA